MDSSNDDATVPSGRKVKSKQSSRKIRSTYSESNIHRAYILASEKKASIRKAAKMYGVPLSTLRDRIARGVNEPRHLGTKPLLPREEEEKLVNHFLLLASSGHSPSRKEIIHLASQSAVSLGKRPADGQLSRRWYDHFKKRWPQLFLPKTNISTSQEALTSYFEKLDQILTNCGIKNRPECMFYVEVAHFQTENDPGKVVESHNLEGKAKRSEKRPKTTVFSCGTAIGTYLPLYFVFKGERCDEMLSDNTIPGSKFSLMNSGCRKLKIFQQFLENHFIPNLPQRTLEEPVILFYDTRLSYISGTLIELCKKNNIILFALPPHTSNTPHPGDKDLLKPLKTYFHKGCQKQLMRERPGEVITRFDICKHASTSYLEACTPLSGINFFQKMGIYPLNPQAWADQ